MGFLLELEGKNAETDWKSSYWTTWFLMDEKADTSTFNSQFRALEKKVWGENDKNDFNLQGLSKVYFSPTDFEGNGIQGNMKHIRIFSAVALLIILVAAFNYIILSTAVSTGRAKEIGIRKTNGASVQSIRNQILPFMQLCMCHLLFLLEWHPAYIPRQFYPN